MQYKLPKQFEGVRIISSETQDGSMNIRHPEGLENALKFLQKNSINLPFCFAEQIHEKAVVYAGKPGSFDRADGIITQENFALAIRTADCVPLILFAKDYNLIGAIHVSRHNLVREIIGQSLKKILESKKIPLKSLCAFLGPHIRSGNYEIKQDVLKELNASKWEKFIKEKGQKYFFDLTSACKSELEQIGVLRDNIKDCGIDTFTSKAFFSARRRAANSPIKTFVTVVVKNG